MAKIGKIKVGPDYRQVPNFIVGFSLSGNVGDNIEKAILVGIKFAICKRHIEACSSFHSNPHGQATAVLQFTGIVMPMHTVF